MSAFILAPLFLAALTSAQSTTTATILLPDVCVTQSAPTVTVLGSNSLTTYSYGCTINSAALSSGLARASSAFAGLSSLPNIAQSKASEFLTNLALPTNLAKRDEDCFGFGSLDVCVPWEVTQGASYWAVHYTAGGVGGLDQECSFGEGGMASGAATCTASGRLDTHIWGDGTGTHTKTFSKEDVDKYWVRDTVAVTAGGPAATTGVFAPTATGSVTGAGAQSTGIAVPKSVPTGVVAMMAGAGGILAAALAL